MPTQDLAFQIVNALLNEGMMIYDVQPSQIEEVVTKVLQVNLGVDVVGKKVHYAKDLLFTTTRVEGALCGQVAEDPTLTKVESEVTCRRCLKSLMTAQMGRGYTQH